jgi:hypothetical protein
VPAGGGYDDGGVVSAWFRERMAVTVVPARNL